MAASSPVARLIDIIEAVELVREEMVGVTIAALASDRRKRWIVERGLEIRIAEKLRELRRRNDAAGS